MLKPELRSTKPQIERFIAGCDRRVWTQQQLRTALTELRSEWNLATRTDDAQFIAFLTSETQMCEVVLEFPSRRYRRFWWGAPTAVEAALAIDSSGYLSHKSAMWFHGLVDAGPTTLYLNIEQQNRGQHSGVLHQAGIDRAFQRPARVSQSMAMYENGTIRLNSGKNTGRLGVISRRHPQDGQVRLTNLPRTLIDIVVRPAYSGGVESVLAAYRSAAGRFDVTDLLRTLRELNHAYPYHQAIGFYIARAGMFRANDLAQVRALGTGCAFYLDYQIERPVWSKEWRLWYPAHLDDI